MMLGGSYSPVTKFPVTPFPDLDPIYEMRLPFYDMKDGFQANDDSYTELLGYIGLNQKGVKSTNAWYGIFCGLCFVGAIGLMLWA